MDLTREEFIYFQEKLKARTLVPVLLITLGFYMLSFFSTLLTSFSLFVVVLCGAGLAAMGVLALCVWLMSRLYYGMVYDRYNEAGMSFYGLVSVTPEQIVKTKADFSLTLPLDTTCLVMENERMFIAMTNNRQTVILPARCITPEQAAILRRAPGYRRSKKGLTPGGIPAEAPAAQQRQVAFEGEVVYTTEEYGMMSKERITAGFWRRSPLYCFIATGVAGMLGLESGNLLTTVVLFLVLMGLQAVLYWWLPQRQLRRALAAGSLPEDIRRMTLRVDDRGATLTMKGKSQGAVPWSAVKHVYDAPPFVKFTAGAQQLYLPQRCISDIAAFSADLDNFRQKSV